MPMSDMSPSATTRSPGLRMTLILALITAMLGGLVSAMAVLIHVKHNEVDSRSAEKVALTSGEVMPDANVGLGDVEQASKNDIASALQAASDERSQIAQSVVEINQRCELLEVELTELIERIQSLERIERGLNARLSDASSVADEQRRRRLRTAAAGSRKRCTCQSGGSRGRSAVHRGHRPASRSLRAGTTRVDRSGNT